MAGFIGAPQMNFLAGRLHGNELRLDCGMVRDIPVARSGNGEAVTLGVRPEAIDGRGDEQVTVRNFEQLGAVTYIYAAFANEERLTVQLARQIPLKRGKAIGVTFKTESFHIFGPDEAVVGFAE